MTLSLRQLAQTLDLEYRGKGDLSIYGVASLNTAGPGDLCFLQHRRYLAELAGSDCAAVVTLAELADEITGKAVLVSANPQLSFTLAINLLNPQAARSTDSTIHPSAQIAESAKIGAGVNIAANVVIDEGVVIGDGSRIGIASIIEKATVIGRDCHLHSRVTIRHSVEIGDRCEFQSGVVVGSDGFGLVQQQQQWLKIPQLGSVRIGDDVEIGANTTIDRGALDDTLIEQGCKLDNQIQVAHNVQIGAHTAIAACVGIAGSAKIGRYCKISGAVVVLGHLSIVDNVTITAMSLVTKDIKEAGVYSSGTPLLDNKQWHRNNVRYKSLDKMAQTLAELVKKTK